MKKFVLAFGLFLCVITSVWAVHAEYAIPLQFDGASSFSEQLAAVKIGAKWGFIDTTGKIVINPRFDRVGKFSQNLAPASITELSNGKWGYIDKNGNFTIQPQFDEARSFSESLAAVKLNGKWGYINSSGQIVINPRYDEANDFSGGLAAVWTGSLFGGKWGYISKP